MTLVVHRNPTAGRTHRANKMAPKHGTTTLASILTFPDQNLMCTWQRSESDRPWHHSWIHSPAPLGDSGHTQRRPLTRGVSEAFFPEHLIDNDGQTQMAVVDNGNPEHLVDDGTGMVAALKSSSLIPASMTAADPAMAMRLDLDTLRVSVWALSSSVQC
jgi:hypothetical protein